MSLLEIVSLFSNYYLSFQISFSLIEIIFLFRNSFSLLEIVLRISKFFLSSRKSFSHFEFLFLISSFFFSFRKSFSQFELVTLTLQCFRSRVTFSSVLFNLRLWKREVTDASQSYVKLLKNWEQIRISSSYLEIEFINLKFKSLWNYKWIILGQFLRSINNQQSKNIVSELI